MDIKDRREYNLTVLELYSGYLRNCPRAVTKDLVDTMTQGYELPAEEAFLILFEAMCGLIPRENPVHALVEKEYLRPSIREQDKTQYENNPYYTNIKIYEGHKGRWELTRETIAPYEAFVFDDILIEDNWKEIPRLGFFTEEFSYPAILENGVEWMTLTPNEINTAEPAIKAARGKVVTFGLGLGYFAYMASEKEDVDQVTVVELSGDVISLFEDEILPQFPHKEKIRIVNMDAFEYALNHMTRENFDMAFVDIWHDVSDGVDLYLHMKELESKSPKTQFVYWIERSIDSFIRWQIFDTTIDTIKTR